MNDVVEVYGKENCPQCNTAKRKLRANGVHFAYHEVDVATAQSVAQPYSVTVKQFPFFVGGGRVWLYSEIDAMILHYRRHKES